MPEHLTRRNLKRFAKYLFAVAEVIEFLHLGRTFIKFVKIQTIGIYG